MTIKQDIINELQFCDHIEDSNTPIRRYFRCWIDGSYNGEAHYKANCAIARRDYNNTAALQRRVQFEFTSYMAHEHQCSYGHAQAAIVASMTQEQLEALTVELIDDLRDLVRDEMEAV